MKSQTESISEALASLRPGAQFNVRGTVIEWLDTVQNQPSNAAITAEINRLAALPTVDQIYDIALMNNRVLKALVIAINKGTLTVGGNKTAAQLKSIIKAEM